MIASILDASMPLSTAPSILSPSSRTRCKKIELRQTVGHCGVDREDFVIDLLTTAGVFTDEGTRAGKPRPGATRATPPSVLAIASPSLAIGLIICRNVT